MEQEVSAAQHNLHEMSGMKEQIDQMFEQGYIYKQPDGSLGLAETEEQRRFLAESVAKQPRAQGTLLA